MVPIVEPEVLMDGEHSAEDCLNATSRSLKSLFDFLDNYNVDITGTLLKPNMITAGSDNPDQISEDEVASLTLECLKKHVPDDLPGIAFLSGGQSDIKATHHLDAMNKMGGGSWKLTFYYGRALQQSALKTWLGKVENEEAAQAAFSHRALMNRLAASGKWSPDLEK